MSDAHSFIDQRSLSKDDYVIVCRDFGGVWRKDEENKEELEDELHSLFKKGTLRKS